MIVGQKHKMNCLWTIKCGTKITEEFLEVLSYHNKSHGKHLQWLLGTLSSAVISAEVLCHE